MLLLNLEYFSQAFSQTLSHYYQTPSCISDYRWNYKADRIFNPHKKKIICISLRWIWDRICPANKLSILRYSTHIKTQKETKLFSTFTFYPWTNILLIHGACILSEQHSCRAPQAIKHMFGITSEMTCQKSLSTTNTLHTGNETTCSQLSVFSR